MQENRVPFGSRDVTEEQKSRLVRDVFTRVSNRYDMMNDAMSLGIHRLWKDAVVNWLAPMPHQHILDLAGGTGDLAKRILGHSPRTRVTVLDLTADMVEVGRDRLRAGPVSDQVSWVVGDALGCPFPTGAFDGCTIGFGIRNFQAIPTALDEIYRLLKFGGKLAILEFSTLRHDVLQTAYDWYSDAIIPRLGSAIANDRDSYVYLVESIRRFPPPGTFMSLMRDAGFESV
ncbi:MAG: class I SAM-dependent methyltransferase, partial [Rhodobacteraceae bacterium]|nr:class I SAM-dependent methyltransferase [Paracoccaceae bacterium]